MNHNFPGRVQPYQAVFVVDLSWELRAFNNLMIDCEVEYESDQRALIEYALRRVLRYWNIYCRKAQPSALFISRKTLGRVTHYTEHALVYKLNTLKQILSWAPEQVIDDIIIDEGVIYFCYITGEQHVG